MRHLFLRQGLICFISRLFPAYFPQMGNIWGGRILFSSAGIYLADASISVGVINWYLRYFQKKHLFQTRSAEEEAPNNEMVEDKFSLL